MCSTKYTSRPVLIWNERISYLAFIQGEPKLFRGLFPSAATKGVTFRYVQMEVAAIISVVPRPVNGMYKHLVRNETDTVYAHNPVVVHRKYSLQRGFT